MDEASAEISLHALMRHQYHRSNVQKPVPAVSSKSLSQEPEMDV